ncbi:MAG TPA: branched-chain amino acid ABC transporter ATP-binding protein/permease [Burkholderiales bacterium]|jgi:branched-chain amino acid transport system permease protein|nr:branched-chain amino acid ABC transporter ATP-binding protein/permease [Burkholderiales bacterium]
MTARATTRSAAQQVEAPAANRRDWRSYLPEIFTAIGLAVAPWVLPLIGAGPDLLGRVLIWGLFGLGFDILFGYTGLLSFGQAAFFGAGGFVTAWLLTAGVFSSILPALAVGTVVAGLLGVIIGFLTLRRTGIYFAMSTLAFGEMLFFLENSPLKHWTGGENGIAGVPPPVVSFGFASFNITQGWPMYTMLAVFFFIGFIIARRIVLSPFGAVLTAIRGNPVRAVAVGHEIKHYKLAAFVVAALYGGLAGGLLGLLQNYMPPDAFMLDTSAQLVIQTVIGGVGTLFGPMLGAWIWLWLYNVLQYVHGVGAYWKLILGVIFVILVIVFRRGICGEIVTLSKRRAARRRAAAAAGSAAATQRHKSMIPLYVVPGGANRGASALEARGLTKHYGGLAAVEGVDFAVAEGELHGLIGPNGAGKSTFFKMIAGEVHPTAGDVFLRGERITRLGMTTICQRGMSKSYQINQLFESLTVRQNLMMPVLARSRGRFRLDLLKGLHHVSGMDDQIDAAMELVELGHRADTAVHDLAYGEKRRLEIGLALATGANILLLDEPLAGMSPEERSHTVALLKRIRNGRTMVVVEHDMDAMFELAENITVLCEGRKLAVGTPDEIQRNKAVQEAYLGGIGEQ